MKMASAMKMTSETIQAINGMMNVKTLAKTGMELQKNMMKMGMMQEMVEETMEVDSDLDEEADDVIDNIVDQIANNTYDAKNDPLVGIKIFV